MRFKVFALTLCLPMALIFAGCSAQPSATEQSAAPTAAPTAAQPAATPEATTSEVTSAVTNVVTNAVTSAVTSTAASTATVASATAAGADPLLFPVDSYTEETETVTTTAGVKEVTYRLYQHIPYVANPVDVEYQSMDVKVPIAVDSKAIDATNAPILFVIAVGGYMSVNNVSGGMAGGAAGGMMGMRPGGEFTGTLPSGVMTGTLPAGAMPPGGMMGGPGGDDTGISGAADLALSAGYVVVEPGNRGRDNQADDGTYFGKAPAAIVDLKAAVRYLRHNQGVMPGNTDWIISRGVSAGGALSALLGASGNSELYAADLAAIGAADEDDTIFASADFCPITDLENADMAYEWMYGATPLNGALVDQDISQQLKDAFTAYQASLQLEGSDGFGPLTADNYGDYLVKAYLIPTANTYLQALSDDARATYLADNPWITWSDNTASFTFADYVAHVGRMKDVPAFDALDLSAAENSLFGNETTNARHFTNFSAQQSSGDATASIDADLPAVVNMMNPMYFIAQGCSGCAENWWIRFGTSDNNTALTVITNLGISLEQQDKNVNTLLYWDAGHGADEDPEAFIAWIGALTGYSN